MFDNSRQMNKEKEMKELKEVKRSDEKDNNKEQTKQKFKKKIKNKLQKDPRKKIHFSAAFGNLEKIKKILGTNFHFFTLFSPNSNEKNILFLKFNLKFYRNICSFYV